LTTEIGIRKNELNRGKQNTHFGLIQAARGEVVATIDKAFVDQTIVHAHKVSHLRYYSKPGTS
jgi:hypothetical protein